MISALDGRTLILANIIASYLSKLYLPDFLELKFFGETMNYR
jgi:hypothetical protein